MKIFALLFLASQVTADNLRSGLKIESTNPDEAVHLDLELEIDGKRELFPLLPGTKCPMGHTCVARSSTPLHDGKTADGMNPLIGSMKRNYQTPLAMSMDWIDMNNELNTVVASDDFCSRRHAMTRAAGLAAGLGLASVSSPAYAAETKEVKMGSDSGLLAFVPQKTTICKGDSVKWIMNKAGPHNVVFDEDNIPAGVDQEAISMSEQIGDEGETFVMKFETAGEYQYYCEPHRGAGMNGVLTVV